MEGLIAMILILLIVFYPFKLILFIIGILLFFDIVIFIIFGGLLLSGIGFLFKGISTLLKNVLKMKTYKEFTI
jgi:hypothetical protein